MRKMDIEFYKNKIKQSLRCYASSFFTDDAEFEEEILTLISMGFEEGYECGVSDQREYERRSNSAG